MIPEDIESPSIAITWLRAVASIIILFQFILFSLLFNFSSNIYILGIGWFLLLIGLGLIIVSSHQHQILSDIKSKRSNRLHRFAPYPIHVGWMVISISLALIIQQWYTILLAIGFVAVVILELRIVNKYTKGVPKVQ